MKVKQVTFSREGTESDAEIEKRLKYARYQDREELSGVFRVYNERPEIKSNIPTRNDAL